MLIGEGSKVRMIYTGDVGKIIRLEGDVAQVQLSDGDIIPCPLENLEAFDKAEAKPANVWNIKSEKLRPLQNNEGISEGAHLAIEFNPEQSKLFPLLLINNSDQSALFSFQLKSKVKQQGKLNAKIKPRSIYHLGDMEFTWLGEGTKAYFEFWPILKNGTGKKRDLNINIKVPQFFENHQEIPGISKYPVKTYLLLKKWEAEKKAIEGQSLSAYTKEKLQWKKWEAIMDNNEITQKAVFNNEIDLHIESLTEYHDSLGNMEILKIQIKHFERHMSEAIKVGAEKVFLIHGIGKGKLRDEIAARLTQYPQVKSFVNEYHPRYGFGATEVIFKG